MSLIGKAKERKLLGKATNLKAIHGYSAYELAVINGFEGTEEEWLASLKGEKGDKGDVDKTALAEVRRYKYDYDCNGVVNGDDAIYLLHHIQESSTDYPIPAWCNADFNGDGVVDETDATDCLTETNFPEKYPHIYDTVPRDDVPKNVANALVGKKSGEEVVLKDVSPLSHEIKVKVLTGITVVGELTTVDHGEWSNEYEYGDYVIESIDRSDGDGKFYFTDGSYLWVGTATGVNVDKINVGDTIRFSHGEWDENFWYAYLVRGFSGDPTTVKVTVSGVMESIALGSPADGNSGGSCFDSGETEFIVDRTEFLEDGYFWIYFTDGRDYWGFAGGISRDDIKAGDRAYISYSYDEAYGEDVPSLYLAKGEYKEPISYTPNADGTVTGVIGDGTPITISNDKGAVLEVEYNRDINKAFEELLNTVKDMVGW